LNEIEWDKECSEDFLKLRTKFDCFKVNLLHEENPLFIALIALALEL
jgi:hypothetical protein